MGYLSEAGPLIWPLLILAVAAIVWAAKFAFGGSRALVPLALGSSVGALILGLLNAALGYQRSVGPLGQLAPDKRWILFAGVAEGLNGVVLALTAGFLVCLFLALGYYRAESSPQAARRHASAER